MEWGILDLYVYRKAENYLKANPERFNNDEKKLFYSKLNNWLCGVDKSIDDEVYDFLIAEKLYHGESRVNAFGNYLTQKYSVDKYKNVLDVGAGRMCRLSKFLAEKGYNVEAIDPNIRLTNAEAKAMGIARISKSKFLCDEYANNGKGTNISNKDLVVALEPCGATEHIIRQCLIKDLPFAVVLCYQNHNALNGQIFETPEDWYRYLKSISEEVKIQVMKTGSFVATNNPDINKKELSL